jgi:hypothetical protein
MEKIKNYLIIMYPAISAMLIIWMHIVSFKLMENMGYGYWYFIFVLGCLAICLSWSVASDDQIKRIKNIYHKQNNLIDAQDLEIKKCYEFFDKIKEATNKDAELFKNMNDNYKALLDAYTFLYNKYEKPMQDLTKLPDFSKNNIKKSN